MNENENKAKKLTSKFFGAYQYVYAKPYTSRHINNYYGNDIICKLNKNNIAQIIVNENAMGEWDSIEETANSIFKDLQFERPKK